jgi:hypothetical protein
MGQQISADDRKQAGSTRKRTIRIADTNQGNVAESLEPSNEERFWHPHGTQINSDHNRDRHNPLIYMVPPAGLEPATP